MTTPLNIRLPRPEEKYNAQNERELRRQIELALGQLASATANVTVAGDGVLVAEGYLYNAGSVLIAGDSDWVFVPGAFNITGAEIVGDPAGTISVSVYSSTYAAWDTWTLVSASAPLTLSASDKNQSSLTGWTTTFAGDGTYFKFTVTGVPTAITKATVTLTLSVTDAVLSDAEAAAYLAAIDRTNHTGTQTADTISDFASATRAQVESELVAGSNVTITPSGSGASRQLTIAASLTGATPAEVLIERKTPSGVGTVTFSSLGSYSDLRLVVSGQGTKAAASAEVRVRCNGDSGANYDYQMTLLNQSNDADIESRAATYMHVGYLIGSTGPSNSAGNVDVRIYDYRGTTFWKTLHGQCYLPAIVSSGGFVYNAFNGGDWRSTSALTSIEVYLDSGNYVAGSAVALYGIL